MARRIRHLQLNSFDEYCGLLKSGDDEEFVNFINAITTNLTSFFRESHHFDYLADSVVPNLCQRQNKINVWSAGCSTGEEPYSIAMTLLENILPGKSASILATDLDSNVVAKASSGIYPANRIDGIPQHKVKKWFKKGRRKQEGYVKVSPDLRKIIEFNQLNLMNSWPMTEKFDIIFCRNVVIYFSKETQKVLFDRYAELLVDGGHLFIGHSENIFKVSDRFDRIGPNSVYHKIK